MTTGKARRSHAGETIRRLNVVYRTPEAEYVLDDLWPYGMFIIAGALYIGWLWYSVLGNAFCWPLSWRVLAAINGVTGAVIAAYYLNRGLRSASHYLFGPGINGRLVAEFTQTRFRVRIGGRFCVFDARQPHQFSMREHIMRAEEGRAEERARTYGAIQLANHYRRAWQVVLDYRGARYVLASVADEAGARDLVRRLQMIEARVMGADGAGVRTARKRVGDSAPSAKRPSLE